ncbi:MULTISPECIES: sulfurtransferase-like selenium metabolism protein YedF [unclassified Clostridium]|uniref:sulfurtransferase-like selenium metabolism protein YedF n=1 Tax=Clostridium TaxID=1485 RepID=UPI001C8BDCA9|nr:MULTISPECIES: sulfurtransferase-like selenium metabolism protein YedF [unclassified Clostridium]MBX9136883.1 sulfurtransferase-like selenium metabolism protein YedF [Clostridium sp. K12(2020)]MBX9143693.1 sulfurtransferase-like selenium metabolism protein YedF [Clostridium sp. K13]MDU2291438.1 sulfurtransferase-like selenium metabolism protein YedF [Clostridium celatum]MDU4327253.1 sulfurtransferase-like selenium metabolism protein YedF [Clostridium celatum]
MKKFIDAKGKNCPMPVIMAKKEIDLGVKFFEIEVDNKIAVENLKKLANSQGFVTKVEENNGNFKVDFSNGCEECEEILEKIEGKKPLGDWAVFVNKEIIGAGSDELGISLMKMFFYTISEGEDLPKSILFMNGGVKVPTLNEQAIEHLKVLENKGVELLVCGACLNFYGLEEKLAVGKISNMYDITNAMKESAKVITI